MEDYKKIIKELLLRYYTSMGDNANVVYLSTFEILVMSKGVVPTQPISEHDIFEIMKELGFGIEKTSILDEETEVERELFLWKLYEII